MRDSVVVLASFLAGVMATLLALYLLGPSIVE